MKMLLRWAGAIVLLAFVLVLLIGPSPFARTFWLQLEARIALAGWREAFEYLAYLSEILLILFFGGFVFVESFARQVSATLGTVHESNVEALNLAIADAGDSSRKMAAYLQKFTTQGRLSYDEWKNWLGTMFRLQRSAANPLHLIRATLWILAHMPGRLYGALALVLVLAKTVSEGALILID